jgi:hypothetical protein
MNGAAVHRGGITIRVGAETPSSRAELRRVPHEKTAASWQMGHPFVRIRFSYSTRRRPQRPAATTRMLVRPRGAVSLSPDVSRAVRDPSVAVAPHTVERIRRSPSPFPLASAAPVLARREPRRAGPCFLHPTPTAKPSAPTSVDHESLEWVEALLNFIGASSLCT